MSLQAGDSEAAWVARHCTMRPPPGATPAHSERTSAPHAERTTNNSSRGRIGRSTSGGAAGAAAAVAVAAPAAAGDAAPLAAVMAVSQGAETLALFFSRHCSAAAP